MNPSQFANTCVSKLRVGTYGKTPPIGGLDLGVFVRVVVGRPRERVAGRTNSGEVGIRSPGCVRGHKLPLPPHIKGDGVGGQLDPRSDPRTQPKNSSGISTYSASVSSAYPGNKSSFV